MTLIYLVVSVILGVVTWVCSNLDWQYGYILTYIFLFLTSWYVSLIFIYQEEYDRTKKFTVWTPAHLIYFVVDIGLLIYLWKYNLKDWQTVKFAKYKAVVLLNLGQGLALTVYFKLRDIYLHL
ncbi:MAG: hypothetical protein IJ867_08040 [Clostridia bacterium]|nr:hypothetical protein [Clostridia bacterium]